MGKLTLITGGVRSGKSRLAVEMARKDGGTVVFVATCVPGDQEMKRRIADHKTGSLEPTAAILPGAPTHRGRIGA